MSFRQIALCAFFGGLLLSPAAQAAKIEQTETYDVPAGASRTFQTTYMTMDTKCRPVKAPRMSLQAPPRYGKVRFVPRQPLSTPRRPQPSKMHLLCACAFPTARCAMRLSSFALANKQKAK
jgi:hypothetical protein